MFTIDIKGRTYKIETKELEDKHGECDPEAKTIYIDTKVGELKEEVILHEIFHAVLAEIFVDTVVDDSWLEVIVSNLALEMTKLKNNKALEEFIHGK